VLDTDILVDALRRFSAGLDYVEEAQQHGALRISITTEMELILGCRNHRELRRLERFLRRCTMLGITERIAEKAVILLRQYRLSHGLGMADALIAATALEHNDTLYTKNVRHFQMILGLSVIRPY
jgi:predicted nucleic acid-binding protein